MVVKEGKRGGEGKQKLRIDQFEAHNKIRLDLTAVYRWATTAGAKQSRERQNLKNDNLLVYCTASKKRREGGEEEARARTKAFSRIRGGGRMFPMHISTAGDTRTIRHGQGDSKQFHHERRVARDPADHRCTRRQLGAYLRATAVEMIHHPLGKYDSKSRNKLLRFVVVDCKGVTSAGKFDTTNGQT